MNGDWIDIKKQKPSDEEIVLCYDFKHDIQIVCMCFYNENELTFCDIYGARLEDNISHWMQLPDSPIKE